MAIDNISYRVSPAEDQRTPAKIVGQRVPGSLKGALFVMLLVAGALSVPLIGRFGPLPTTTLLDAWIGAFIVLSICRGKTVQWPLFLLIIAYALTRFLPALYSQSPPEDVLQAYRWVIYLLAFSLAVGRSWGTVGSLRSVFWILLGMALAKSVLTFAVARDGARPGLLLENNFELALFCGLGAVLYRHISRGRILLVTALGLLTILSGSRSGAFAFVVFAVYAVAQIPRTKENAFKIFALLCFLPALVLVPISIFASRTETVRIDRLNFLDVFLYETRDFDIVNWAFGTFPITPLSDGCDTLSYYQNLFASSGDGTCYSVILHAFVLRVIFDAGIAGLLVAFGVMLYTLRQGRVRTSLAITLVGIAATNSLSVSGPNNPYVALPVLLAILLAGVTTIESPSSTGVRADVPSG